MIRKHFRWTTDDKTFIWAALWGLVVGALFGWWGLLALAFAAAIIGWMNQHDEFLKEYNRDE